MNTHEALMTRRTIHEFRSDPLPEGAVARALEAALRAPNHKLTNPWRFTQVGPKARSSFVDIAAELKFGPDFTAKQREGIGSKMESSPVFLAVSQVISADSGRRHEDFAAVACAIQNLSLSLWADGIGSKWSTTGAIRDARVYALLGIDPSLEEIVGVVFVGYAEVVPNPPRRPLEEVFRTVP